MGTSQVLSSNDDCQKQFGSSGAVTRYLFTDGGQWGKSTDTTKPVDAGTGLGLSVVHGIMQAHEGVITVDSQPGEGATFTVVPAVVEGETRAISFVNGLGSPADSNTMRLDGIDQPSITDGATITFVSQPSFIRWKGSWVNIV